MSCHNDMEILNLVRKEAADCHLYQDCIDKLEQESADGPWDVEKRARYGYYG